RERPPYDPYSARDAVRGATNDNVVTLPGRGGETAQKPVETPEPAERWKGIAEAGSPGPPGGPAGAPPGRTFGGQQFSPRRAGCLRDDRPGLCRGGPAHAQESAVTRRL